MTGTSVLRPGHGAGPELARWWTETVAAAGDVLPLPLLTTLLLVGAVLAAAGWYWFPAWVPRRLPRLPGLPRLRRPGWRRRRADRAAADPVVAGAGDRLPDLPAAAFTSLADRIAAQGRYAEAVRERFRAMIRELIEHGLLAPRPEWTVTELADAAAAAWPAVGPPLRTAGSIFSELWYGRRPATAGHDARMRALAEELTGILRSGGVDTVRLPADPERTGPQPVSGAGGAGFACPALICSLM